VGMNHQQLRMRGEGGGKRRHLAQFSASFRTPVQDISPATINALARQVYEQLGRITLNFVRASSPVLKTASHLSFCSLEKRALFAIWWLLESYLRAAYSLSLSKMALRSCHCSTLLGAALRLP